MRHTRAHEIRIPSHAGHRLTINTLKDIGIIRSLTPPREGTSMTLHRSSHTYGLSTKFETNVFYIVQASLPVRQLRK
jgi:hypothetical protein